MPNCNSVSTGCDGTIGDGTVGVFLNGPIGDGFAAPTCNSGTTGRDGAMGDAMVGVFLGALSSARCDGTIGDEACGVRPGASYPQCPLSLLRVVAGEAHGVPLELVRCPVPIG